MSQGYYCPMLSFMKASPAKCLGQSCSWWAGGKCAVLEIAQFFQERRFDNRPK